MKGEVEVLAGGLELGHELRSAVDLQRGDGERHLLQVGLEEAGGVASGGARVAGDDQVLAEGADGLELLEADAGQAGGIEPLLPAAWGPSLPSIRWRAPSGRNQRHPPTDRFAPPDDDYRVGVCRSCAGHYGSAE